MHKLPLLALVACGLFSTALTGRAQVFTGLNTGGTSIAAYSAPGATPISYSITGLNAGDALVGIDYFTSSGGALYGMGSSGTLYSLAQSTTTTYAATVASNTNAIPGATVVDFNPVANRLRVYAGVNNFRLTPGVGNAPTSDGMLAFVSGDPNFGVTPSLTGAAYTNNSPGATATSLYSLDANLDALILNTGTPQFNGLTTVGTLTFSGSRFDITTGNTGFDITSIGGNNVGYLTKGNALYSVNLTNGVLTSLGTQVGTALIDVAFVPEPGTYALIGLGCFALAFQAVRRRHQSSATA